MQKCVQCEHPLNIHLKQPLHGETLLNAVVFGSLGFGTDFFFFN